jgi:hypothetical protein
MTNNQAASTPQRPAWIAALELGLIGNPSRACISYVDNLTSSAVTPDVVEAIQERNADTSGKGGELGVRSRKGAG